jgi:hypothetical protein
MDPIAKVLINIAVLLILIGIGIITSVCMLK